MPDSRSASRSAWGHGLATVTPDGTVLDTWFPSPALGAPPAEAPAPAELEALAGDDAARGVRTEVRLVQVDLDTPPDGASDAYLRLHLLSHRLVPPNSINLDGVFGALSNVVWTSAGPCAVDGFEQTRLRLRALGPVQVHGVDKFPRMTDYVLPAGVRIADADRVRLGAHLAEGTTVMHEGFVNFNAGTLGTAMVEGRVSAGVVVGDGSDVGGGASIMGTLSGGGKERISIGRGCLLGANAGIGISLGRRLRRRGGSLRDGRHQGGRRGRRRGGRGQGRRALRPQRPAVPPQLAHRRRRGAGAHGHRGRRGAEHRPARELTWRLRERADRPRAPRTRATAWRRRGLALLVVGVLVASGAAIGQALFANRYVPPLRETCVASVDGTGYELDPDQAANAALITAIAVQRGMPARAATIAIATAIQESKLRNIDYGDRDSLGLFQQRPSQGWGTQAQVTDPVYATNAFYDALAKIEGYETMEITAAAQAVQRSGFPEAYADHEPEGRAFASALTGYSQASLGCRLRGADEVADPAARAGEVRAALDAQLGGLTWAPAPTTRPRSPPPRRPTTAGLRLAWAAAHWAVASADEYDVVRVQVGTRVWDRTGADDGWTEDPDATGSTVQHHRGRRRRRLTSA